MPDAQRDATQRSLQSQRFLYTDTTRWSVELQTNWEFAGGKGRAVGGLAYTEDYVDTEDPETGEQRPQHQERGPHGVQAVQCRSGLCFLSKPGARRWSVSR